MTANQKKDKNKTVYRVEGFSCINCAGIFEKNVKSLPNVIDAKVNFGAAKVTVYGQTTMEELEKAGSFENLRIIPEKQHHDLQKEPYWKTDWHVLASLFFLVIGFLLGLQYGEGTLGSSLAYGAAILIGGFLSRVGSESFCNEPWPAGEHHGLARLNVMLRVVG